MEAVLVLEDERAPRQDEEDSRVKSDTKATMPVRPRPPQQCMYKPPPEEPTLSFTRCDRSATSTSSASTVAERERRTKHFKRIKGASALAIEGTRAFARRKPHPSLSWREFHRRRCHEATEC